ncbi:hypothetical protein B4S18_02210 [Acinetobacter baumannii]|nr:hypothetical protein CAT71_15835 [Acinetobacter baumannii]OVN15299.1 hypothetical protein B4S18_02210 [Acinetobacter baumannii]
MRIWINEKIVNSIKKMILTILFIESVVVKKINEALIPTAHIKVKANIIIPNCIFLPNLLTFEVSLFISYSLLSLAIL